MGGRDEFVHQAGSRGGGGGRMGGRLRPGGGLRLKGGAQGGFNQLRAMDSYRRQRPQAGRELFGGHRQRREESPARAAGRFAG
jgi:hypothetical protein